MLCNMCGKNPATIHIQEIIGSEKKVLHLCQDCAEKKAREDTEFKDFNLAEVLFQISSQIGNHIHKEDSEKPAEEQPKIVCPVCGWDSESFQKTGKLGCPECYLAFREMLGPIADTMHRGTVHTGKHPVPSGGTSGAKPKPSASLAHMSIKHLQSELEEAVSAERYEDAAVLRDRIAELRRELEAMRDEN